jgi:hypothetical protein
MASAQRTSSGNLSRSPCDPQIPCVPYFFNDRDPLIRKDCPTTLLQQCYKPRAKDIFFYNGVNWQLLTKHFEEYMKLFAERLSENREIAELLQQTYTYGPFPPEEEWPTSSRPTNYANIEARVIKNDDYNRCYNLMANLVLNRGVAARPGITEQIISHISLHPRQPKFYRDTLRSRSGCGFYNRPDGCRLGENEESHPTDSGPFHYTINTVTWGEKEISCEGPNMEFQVDEDPSRQGYFLPVVPGSFEEALSTIPFTFQEQKLPGQNGVITNTKSRLKRAFEEKQRETETTQALANAQLLETEKEAIRKQALALGFDEERIEEAMKRVTKNVQKRVKEREKAKEAKLKANQESAIEEAIRRLRIQNLRSKGTIGEEEENNVGFARYQTERIQQQRERLNRLHLLIFREFIDFWNTVMFPLGRPMDIRSMATGEVLPPVGRRVLPQRVSRVTAVGGTRKHKHSGKKTRRLRTDKHK